MRRLAALTLLACLCVTAGARAQMDSREGIALQNQILELRRDLQNLRDQMGRGGGGYAPAPRGGGGGGGEMVAQLLDRVNNLEEQMRHLNGRNEEMANRLQRLSEDVNKQLGDINFRLQALEGGGRPGGAPAAIPAPRTPGGMPTATPPMSNDPPGGAARAQRTPEAMMQEGNAALARRDYATAEAAARDVLALRNSPRAYDAQFLLAQSLAGRRDYAQAAVAYDDTYKRARTGRYAQDALLGLANSLAAINEKRSACDTLNTLRAEFPAPRPEVRDSANNLRQRAGCR
jgi:TolA-binding protein